MSLIKIDVEQALRPFWDRLTTKVCVLEQALLGRTYSYLQGVLPKGTWLVVVDAITHKIAGEEVIASLEAARQPHALYVIEPADGEETPVADDKKVALLQEHIQSAGSQIVACVAVGAGTVNDIAKMATFRAGVPYAVVATAPSMNGYTSGIAALLSDGVKTTQGCHAPVACLVDLDVMAQSPARMIASGFGDLLSKPVSNADWRLGYLLNDAGYSSDAMVLVEAGSVLLEGVASKLPLRHVEAVGRLSASLCLSGLSMSLAGSSSPASGGEHLISHYIDMTHFSFGEGHDFHGCQVGVGTITTAAMYEKLAAMDPTTIDVEARVAALQPWPTYEAMLRERFGTLYSAVESHAKQAYPSPEQLRTRLTKLKEGWDAILADVRETLRSAKAIREELLSAACPVTFREIGVTDERARRAVVYCKDIRARYTILHLAGELGMLDVWADEILRDLHGVEG
ncbi:MAG: iron-containing alcohol dehydrogenase [Myxococcales bacterium]|nr:iron-containing alcohol dehydrogenase [Myxococcales bacterium]